MNVSQNVTGPNVTLPTGVIVPPLPNVSANVTPSGNATIAPIAQCNQQSTYVDGQCVCNFNYSIFTTRINDTYTFDIDNFLTFSNDIPTDSTPFLCANLFDLATYNLTLISNLTNDFQKLQCSISRYFYLMFDPRLPLDRLSVLNVPSYMNDAFVNGQMQWAIKREKLGDFKCLGKDTFNYTLNNLGLVNVNKTVVPVIKGCSVYDQLYPNKCF